MRIFVSWFFKNKRGGLGVANTILEGEAMSYEKILEYLDKESDGEAVLLFMAPIEELENKDVLVSFTFGGGIGYANAFMGIGEFDLDAILEYLRREVGHEDIVILAFSVLGELGDSNIVVERFLPGSSVLDSD